MLRPYSHQTYIFLEICKCKGSAIWLLKKYHPQTASLGYKLQTLCPSTSMGPVISDDTYAPPTAQNLEYF